LKPLLKNSFILESAQWYFRFFVVQKSPKSSRNQWVKYGSANIILKVKNVLSKIELEFLKSPESFDADYRRVLRHRVNSKVQELREEMELLQKCGFGVTENCNGVTENCNGQQNQQNPNQAAFAQENVNCGAPAGIRTRVFGSKGRNT
jgi:hypothetical protein